jgi:hypothetical protein
VSADGTLLAVVGYIATPPGQPSHPGQVARIDTSSGNEGNVLWTDAGGIGTHGFRGVEVTDDNQEVFTFGQVTGQETLTDTSGATTTLRSRGSYEVFVAAYDAADGKGRYAMDGGGTGMEYFFAMAKDPDTHALYLGGTSRSEYLTWGNVKRKNVMYNGDPGMNNPDTSSAVGSSKAFVVKLTSTMSIPSCLLTCADPLHASNVNPSFCYIDRYCFADGESAPYAGSQCYKCDASKPLEWSGPDMSAMCFIEDECIADGAYKQVRAGRSMVDDKCQQCDVSKSTTSYSAKNGCELPSDFVEGCYDNSGSFVLGLNSVEAMKAAAAEADDAMAKVQEDCLPRGLTLELLELLH